MRGISRLAFWGLLVITVVLPSCGGYINNPVPTLTSLSPDSITAESPQFILKVQGNNLTPSSTVTWTPSNSVPVAVFAIFINIHEMDVTVTSNLIQNPGQVNIQVFTPQPGGGTSGGLTFTITPKASPVPTITSVNPPITDVGSVGILATITGKGFVTESVVEIDGTNLTTTFNSSTSLDVSIPASFLTTSGNLPIAVLNPAPGGGLSNIFDIALQYPVPRIDSISPTSQTAGARQTAVALTGSGFTQATVVFANGTPLATTPGGAAAATGLLPAAMLTNGGILQITASNPAPGGGVSNVVAFAVNPTAMGGLPILVDLSSTTLNPGGQAISGICGTLAQCQTATNGVEPLITSGPSASQTGQFVAFASISDNLVQNDASPESQIYLRDTCLGEAASCTPETTLASVDPNGGVANGPSAEPSIDTGGAHVAFSSLATNLVTAVAISGTHRQVFWTTPCKSAAGCTSIVSELVSTSADGASEGNGDSSQPAISPDGRFVAFVSLATNLASGVLPNGVTPQVYVTDTCSGVASAGCFPTTYLVSSPDGVTPGNGPSGHPAISSNGQFVTFTSTASNLGPQAPNPSHVSNIFISQVCYLNQTSCTFSDSLVSTPDGVTPGNATSDASTVSNNGRFIGFQSVATNLIVGIGPTQQIYVRDTCLTNTVTTSCTPATYLVSTPDGVTGGNDVSETPSMDATGQFFAFASRATNLSPNTANGVENIFARNTCLTVITSSTTTCSPVTTLVSQPTGTLPAPANGNSLRPSLASQGHVAAFLSFSSNLVPNDANGALGIGDAFLGTTTF